MLKNYKENEKENVKILLQFEKIIYFENYFQMLRIPNRLLTNAVLAHGPKY